MGALQFSTSIIIADRNLSDFMRKESVERDTLTNS